MSKVGDIDSVIMHLRDTQEIALSKGFRSIARFLELVIKFSLVERDLWANEENASHPHYGIAAILAGTVYEKQAEGLRESDDGA